MIGPNNEDYDYDFSDDEAWELMKDTLKKLDEVILEMGEAGMSEPYPYYGVVINPKCNMPCPWHSHVIINGVQL